MRRKSALLRKVQGRRGITRLAALLLVLILLLAAAIGIQVYRGYKAEADVYSCSLAVDKAQDMLDIAFIQTQEMTAERAEEVVNESRVSRDTLCPANGEYFVVENPGEEQPYEVVCGLHDSDTARRTRLCADRALERVRFAVQAERNKGTETPERVTITLNNRSFEAVLVTEEPGIDRGTYTTDGYEGTVLFYGLAGVPGAFEHVSGAEAGSVCYFCYADENHCALWSAASDGWSGDSWSGAKTLAG